MASTSPNTSQSGPSRRFRRAKRSSVLVLAALGVGLAGGTAAYAASSTPAPTPTAGSSSSATPGAHHGGKPRSGGAGAQGVGGGGGARHSRGGGHHGGKGGKGGQGGGTITALTASTLTVALADNTSRTYTLSSATTVHQGPASAARSALAVGEHVRVRASDPAASIPTALDVDIRAPHVNGRISAVGADTLTVVDPDGFTRTVHTNPATSYARGGQATSRGALTVGTSIRATGTVDADHTDLDATRVDIPTPHSPAAGPGAPAVPAAPNGAGASSSTPAPATGS